MCSAVLSACLVAACGSGNSAANHAGPDSGALGPGSDATTGPHDATTGGDGSYTGAEGGADSTTGNPPDAAADAADAGGDGSTLWEPLRIGAGGFVIGIDIAADGTKVVRTDTYGAYLATATGWRQLVTASTLPVSFAEPGNNAGVYEIPDRAEQHAAPVYGLLG